MTELQIRIELLIRALSTVMDSDEIEAFKQSLFTIFTPEIIQKSDHNTVSILVTITDYLIYQYDLFILKNGKSTLRSNKSNKEKEEYIRKKASSFLKFIEDIHFHYSVERITYDEINKIVDLPRRDITTTSFILTETTKNIVTSVLNDIISNPQEYNPYKNRPIIKKTELRQALQKLDPKPKVEDLNFFMTYSLNMIPIHKFTPVTRELLESVYGFVWLE